ncbi:hypothetical protein EVAR_51672_1 [Eumeta japonica]|uniref:Uncharacterized protein n=1 Tax=Eumeta variegata TaxID=151549 RepID=A0A4C1Y706_EUMVA|nr:hypothetical protein EVAR_51672_1 [Eumeta japonica]
MPSQEAGNALVIALGLQGAKKTQGQQTQNTLSHNPNPKVGKAMVDEKNSPVVIFRGTHRKSTDLSDTAQLAIFIGDVDKEFTITEELLALQPLKVQKALSTTEASRGGRLCAADSRPLSRRRKKKVKQTFLRRIKHRRSGENIKDQRVSAPVRP